MSENPANKRKGPFDGLKNVTCGRTYMAEQDSFSFLWTVSDYAELSKLDEVKSPIFHGGPKTNHKWQLLLWPKKEVENVEYLSLHVWLVGYGHGDTPKTPKKREVKVNASFLFSILNADGHPAVTPEKFTKSFRKSDGPVGIQEIISSTDLVDPTRQLVVNDSIKILCQGWIEEGIKIKHTLGYANGAPSDVKRQRRWKDGLVKSIDKIYKQSIATDVTIKVGSSTLKAHKAILTARSPVFDAMFNNANGMLEAETATVTISDFDEEVVKGMLEHVYTGNTDSLAERAPELLQIAEKYGLTGLKEHSEYVIANSLNNDNVFEILTLADKHNASFLKPRAADYIKLNKRELLQMESFQAEVKANAKSSGCLIAELFLQQ